MDRRRQPHTPEHRSRISAARRGIPWTAEMVVDRGEKVLCACGCGTWIFRYTPTKNGRPSRPRQFAKGHDKRRPNWKELAGTTKLCECGCGTVIWKYERRGKDIFPSDKENRFATGHHLRGKARSLEVRAKISCNRAGKGGLKGAAHPQWKGGVTPEHRKHRQSKEYKDWRDAVYARDGWRCRYPGCGKHLQKGNIAAHHVESFWENEARRFDVSNGVTYCRRHHAVVHGLGTGVRGSD